MYTGSNTTNNWMSIENYQKNTRREKKTKRTPEKMYVHQTKFRILLVYHVLVVVFYCIISSLWRVLVFKWTTNQQKNQIPNIQKIERERARGRNNLWQYICDASILSLIIVRQHWRTIAQPNYAQQRYPHLFVCKM